MPGLRRLASWLLAAVLLAGQQVALEHPLTHATAAGGKSPLCEQHAALGTVLGAIDCAAAQAAPVALEVAAVAALQFPARDDAPLAAASRDPPQLL